MGKRFLVGVALLGVSTAALWAQDMQTDPTEAYKLASSWITESSAKHRAWAAQSIVHFRFESLYPELLARLSEFQPSDSGKFSGSEDELAMESIADAIIRSDLQPPATDSRKLYPQFPALAMILLARAPDDRQAALWSIFERAQVPEVWLAAANLLAKEPPPGFISKLLDDFSMFVRILVFGGKGGGGASYGDCYRITKPPTPFPAGWPRIRAYSLEVGARPETIIAAGRNSVSFTSREQDDSLPWNSESDCVGPDRIRGFRVDLLAQLAGVDTSATGLSALVFRDLVWRSDEQYRRDATGILKEQRQSFVQLVKRLTAAGLSTDAEASERLLHIRLEIMPFEPIHSLPELPDLVPSGIVVTPLVP
jgi:hypothetical protein